MSTYKCIVVIVKRGDGEDVVTSASAHGARGGTIIHGRGTSVRENKKVFGTLIEPEKDIVLIVTNTDILEKVMDGIRDALDLEAPGKGILFTIDLDRVEGILDA